jgi:hypothetical protein
MIIGYFKINIILEFNKKLFVKLTVILNEKQNLTSVVEMYLTDSLFLSKFYYS